MGKQKSNQPRVKQAPNFQKEPKIQKNPNRKNKPTAERHFRSDDSGKVLWSFSLVESDGPWGFSIMSQAELYNLITSEFKAKEGLNWAEVKASGSHIVQTYKLIKKAQKRLEELNQDDLSELFSMRFTGKIRVWGIRELNVFKVLWWDPEHQICPSNKKHT